MPHRCVTTNKPRCEIPQLFSHKYSALIKEYILLVPAKLIFNIDADGFSDWKQRKSKLVVIATGIRLSIFHFPVYRVIRRQTLICCITSAGDAYSSLLASSDPAMRQVFDQGIREGIDI
jgi:hypothetical protein